MPNVLRELRSLTGVAANSTVTAKLPVKNRRYDFIALRISDGALALTDSDLASRVKDIRLIADGVKLIDVSATFLLRLSAFYGLRKFSHMILIPLARYEFNTTEEARAFGIGTQNLGNLTLEIDLGAFTNSPSVEVYYWAAPSQEPLGRHIRMKRTVYGSAISTGDLQINDYLDTLRPQGREVGLVGMHFNSRFFDEFSLKTDGQELIGHRVLNAYEQMVLVETDRMASRYFDSAWAQFDFALGSVTNILNLTGVGLLEMEFAAHTAVPGGISIFSETMHSTL
ncbi:MAG: major capsid protein P2 [Alphaproteobacteria bacterium]